MTIKKLVLAWSFAFLVTNAQADISVEELQLGMNITLSQEVIDDFKPLLKDYNKDRSNKAISFALIESGGYAMGMSTKAPSEAAAATLANLQCENWLKQNEQEALCEIVLLGEQIIRPGRMLREGVGPDTPAMAWKVKGPKGNIYLLGTVHVLKSTLFPLPAVFDQFFNAADVVVFEINPVLQSDPQRLAEANSLMSADPKQQKKLYDKDARKRLKRYLKSQGIHMNAAYSAQPVFNALQVTQLKTAAMGYSLATGVETHYARQASIHGKAIRELETMTEALAALFELTPELQVEMLLDTIDGLDEVATGIETLIEHWMHGDAEGVYQQTVKDLAEEPQFASVATGILDDRNIAWMSKLDAMLEQEGDVVVMVGTAHYGGEFGLLNLLKERGYNPIQYTWSGEPLSAKEQ